MSDDKHDDKALSILARLNANMTNSRDLVLEYTYIQMDVEEHEDEDMERRKEIVLELARDLRASAELVSELEDDTEDD